LQNKVSEGGSSHYQKVFKVHLSQPDFTANAGYFFTLAWKGPVTAKHIKFTSCIVKEMTVELDKSGRGDQNLVKITNLVILAKKVSLGSTFSGTWVAQGTNYYNSHDFTFKHADSTTMEWLKCSLKLDNGAEPLDKDSDGTPKTFFLNWPKLGTGQLDATLWYNANTTGTITDLAADYNAGTIHAYSLINSVADSTSGHVKIVVYGVMNAVPFGSENRQMIAPLSLVLGHNTIATNDLIIATIADGIDQTP
jgi:hypothetical protein